MTTTAGSYWHIPAIRQCLLWGRPQLIDATLYLGDYRDGVLEMAYRTRINYTVEQKAEMWDRWQRGESLREIGRAFDRPSSSIFGQLAPSGGIRPAPRRRSGLALTLLEREEISRGVASNLFLRTIAAQLGRSPSTISRELTRNGGPEDYRASQADGLPGIARGAPNSVNWLAIQC